MRYTLAALACLVVLSDFALAGELWVDAAAGQGGDGSAAKPFNSVATAIKSAKGGDVVTLRAGVYRESISIAQSGTPEQPTVLRAAAGERVIFSGFAPITGWTDDGNGIFTATIQGSIPALYVGLEGRPIARWPEIDLPMRYMKSVDAEKGTITDASVPTDAPFLGELAADPASLKAYMFVASGNYYTAIPVSALNAGTGELTLAEKSIFKMVKGDKDRYQLANHRALIRKPGEWAYEKIDDKTTRVYYRPASPADLQKTQYPQLRRLVHVGHFQNRVANVRIEGLEFQGAAGPAIELGNSDNVTVAGNLACFNMGNGISVRNCKQVTLRNNVLLQNANGLSIASTQGGLVENNEIALNLIDGLIVAGNVSGRPGHEPETTDILVRRNYIHHHALLGHPDNIQTYRGVKNLRIEDTLCLWGGQGLMTEENDGCSIHNSVFAGSGAVQVIFGHSNSNDWKVTNSTVGLGGWGLFSLTGKQYVMRNNIVWEGAMPLADSLDSDYNLFWRPDPAASIANTSKPWRHFASVADVASATDQEKHSLRADPRFRNAPAIQVVSPWHDDNTPGQLSIRFGNQRNNDRLFAVGDKVEISGDGIPRDVTEVTPDHIRFTPALPGRPFRDAFIWNWKNAESVVPDFRPAEGSPALTAGENGGPSGANLDIPAYMNGDFDGDGKRDLPAVPDDVRSALPHPSKIVVPLDL